MGERSARGWGVFRSAVFWTGLALFAPVLIAALVSADRVRPLALALALVGAVCGLAMYWSFRLPDFLGRLIGGFALGIAAIVVINTSDPAARSALAFAGVGALVTSAALFHRGRSRKPRSLPDWVAGPIEPAAGRIRVPPASPDFSVIIPRGWTAWSTSGGEHEGQVAVLYRGYPSDVAPRIALLASPADGLTLDDMVAETKRMTGDSESERLGMEADDERVSVGGAPGVRVTMRLRPGGGMASLLWLASVVGAGPVFELIAVERGGWIYGGVLMGISRDAEGTRKTFADIMRSLRWE